MATLKGNDDRAFRNVTVQALSGHRRSQAELCLPCGRRLTWMKKNGAKYLPDAPDIVDIINSLLKYGDVVNLVDQHLPTGVCGSCLRQLRSVDGNSSFAARLRNRLKTASSYTVAQSTRTWSCGGVASCAICRAAESPRARGNNKRVRNFKRKACDVADKENAPPCSPSATISQAQMSSALSSTNISGRQSLKLSKALNRATNGDVIVQQGLKDAITRRNHTFLPYLKVVELDSDTHAVASYVADVAGFCKLWCAEQSLCHSDVKLIRGSADGGGKTIKISFSFLTLDEPLDCVVAETGVRQVCMFVLATGVKESYHVMQRLLQLIDTRALESFFSSAKLHWAQDTKMNWCFSGKTHGGSYPCVACLRPNSDGFNDAYKLRTFGDNAADTKRYLAYVDGKSGAYERRAYSKFNNCVRPALLDCDPDEIILETLTPNPLHGKLRTINKLMNDLDKAYPEVATAFISRIGLSKEQYHDEFEGRACSTIARKHNVLRDVIKEQRRMYVMRNGARKKRRISSRLSAHVTETTHHSALHVADALEAMDGVMKFMFGRHLDESYRHCVEDFKLAIGKISSSVTVSMHMMIDHAPRFCDDHNCGLLAYSEETAESLHSETNMFLARWKISKVGSVNHSKTLLNVLSAINSAHLYAA